MRHDLMVWHPKASGEYRTDVGSAAVDQVELAETVGPEGDPVDAVDRVEPAWQVARTVPEADQNRSDHVQRERTVRRVREDAAAAGVLDPRDAVVDIGHAQE